MAVDKKYRRKGIAASLLKKIVEVSRKEQPKLQKYAFSSTDARNKASIRLHMSVGFKKIGILKKLHFGEKEIFFAYKLR